MMEKCSLEKDDCKIDRNQERLSVSKKQTEEPSNKIYIQSLGSSFQPLVVNNWSQYLEEERKLFFRRYTDVQRRTADYKDFSFLMVLGRGSYGFVLLSRYNKTGTYYAVKSIKASILVKQRNFEHTLNEKRILQAIRFPFAVYMDYFMEDAGHWYFVLPLALGGELFFHISKVGFLKDETAKFYTAQVILVLEYLHYMDVIFRDLKPENVLIDHQGYIKVTDFGLSKVATRTYTFCGTLEYMAPEIIEMRGYGKSVDWWALGVFIYELLSGITPFTQKRSQSLYDSILDSTFEFPAHFDKHAKHLIRNLLQPDLTKRYGVLKNGVDDIKKHAWFKQFNWNHLLSRRINPPYIPNLNSVPATLHFPMTS